LESTPSPLGYTLLDFLLLLVERVFLFYTFGETSFSSASSSFSFDFLSLLRSGADSASASASYFDTNPSALDLCSSAFSSICDCLREALPDFLTGVYSTEVKLISSLCSLEDIFSTDKGFDLFPRTCSWDGVFDLGGDGCFSGTATCYYMGYCS